MQSGHKKHRPLPGWEESFPGDTVVKNLLPIPKMQGMSIQPLGWETPLEKDCLKNSMDRGICRAIQFMGSQRVEHDGATKQAHTPGSEG